MFSFAMTGRMQYESGPIRNFIEKFSYDLLLPKPKVGNTNRSSVFLEIVLIENYNDFIVSTLSLILIKIKRRFIKYYSWE